jgi:hypothetical protein
MSTERKYAYLPIMKYPGLLLPVHQCFIFLDKPATYKDPIHTGCLIEHLQLFDRLQALPQWWDVYDDDLLAPLLLQHRTDIYYILRRKAYLLTYAGCEDHPKLFTSLNNQVLNDHSFHS